MDDMKELSRAFAEAMKLGLAQEDSRRAIAVKIVKTISDSMAQEDLASLLLTKEYIPLGQTVELKVPGKLKAYWHEPGSYAPRTQMVNKVFQIPTALISAHPEYELGQLESGRYGTMQEQIDAAKEALQGAINAKVFNTLIGSITSGANYATCSGKLTFSALNDAINYVEDQVGGATAIVGRRNVLSSILDFGTDSMTAPATDTGIFSDEMKNQVMKTGKIQLYRGIPLVGLTQWRDAFGKVTVDEGNVLVIGKDVGRYVVSQELRSADAIDVDNLVWHIHLYMRVGCGVIFPERMYRLQIVP